jgi:hypothetical protein
MSVKIQIPKASEREVVEINPGKNGMNSDTKRRFEKIDQVVYGVMIAVVLAMVAVIISVVGIFLDQIRFNNLIYKDYLQKTEEYNQKVQINQDLINKSNTNQELILKQQELIKNLLKK